MVCNIFEHDSNLYGTLAYLCEDIDLPKKPSEVGVIRRLFLDPSASHLIVTTTLAENYYLHTQSRTPKALSRLKGVVIESISWNPSQPTASTREILVGASDGNVYEVYIEPSSEFYRREERYLKSVYRTNDGPITGLWTDTVSGRGVYSRYNMYTSFANLPQVRQAAKLSRVVFQCEFAPK
jgi:hypothetical protein